MTRDQLVKDLTALAHLFAMERVEIWRVIVDKDGNEIQRIFRCAFYRRKEQP